ncbi:hypothetical protein AGLY_000134 [Aphis glycines]|uniref:Uncharacterized protein n=1 Tax=Aphis glycines TaxID=307491 RepID=A0A6G0U8I2_APHGL|nr:hypothetical protein AGLY_000134 [Aphis glycines]
MYKIHYILNLNYAVKRVKMPIQTTGVAVQTYQKSFIIFSTHKYLVFKLQTNTNGQLVVLNFFTLDINSKIKKFYEFSTTKLLVHFRNFDFIIATLNAYKKIIKPYIKFSITQNVVYKLLKKPKYFENLTLLSYNIKKIDFVINWFCLKIPVFSSLFSPIFLRTLSETTPEKKALLRTGRRGSREPPAPLAPAEADRGCGTGRSE